MPSWGPRPRRPSRSPGRSRRPPPPALAALRVVAVAQDAQGSLLLVRRQAAGGAWGLPEGAPLRAELTRDAAARTVRRSAGLTVECRRLLWVAEHASMFRVPAFVFYFLAAAEGPLPQSPDGWEAGFFSRDDLPTEAWLPGWFWDSPGLALAGPDPWRRGTGERP